MTYPRSSLAMNTGKCARNRATAPRRALDTLACWLAGRIGNSNATDSSEVSMLAISRRNASPFLRPTVDRNADMATRRYTASGVGGGKGSASDSGCRLLGMADIATPEDDSKMNGFDERLANHKYRAAGVPQDGFDHSERGHWSGRQTIAFVAAFSATAWLALFAAIYWLSHHGAG